MTRQVIRESIDQLKLDRPTLINADGLDIKELVIYQPETVTGRDHFLCELRGSNCKVGRVVIHGCADDSTDKAAWNASVASGLLVTGHNNVIGQAYAQRVHIPYLVTGTGNRLARLYAELASGDGFNLCGNHNDIYLADFSSLITTFPYEEYHPDVGMMYQKGGGVLLNCNAYNVMLHCQGHRWEDSERQGFLADHVTAGCGIYNFRLNGVHPEHGASWANAVGCTVMNLETNGSVRFDRKSQQVMAETERGNRYV